MVHAGRDERWVACCLGSQNAARLDSEIIYDRDFEYDYFGFKTLERSYLLRVRPGPFTLDLPQKCLPLHSCE